MTEEKKKLGGILVERGVIDRHQLNAALERQKKFDRKLGETMVDMGFINEDTLSKILSEHFRVPSIEVEQFPVEPQALSLLQKDFCQKHAVIPIALRKIKGQTRLVVVTADPSDVSALDEVRFIANLPLAVAVASLSSIRRAIDKNYGGKKVVERDEITITTTVRPEDAVMEIIRAGDQDKIVLENVGPFPFGPGALGALIRLLVTKGVLSQEEADLVIKS